MVAMLKNLAGIFLLFVFMRPQTYLHTIIIHSNSIQILKKIGTFPTKNPLKCKIFSQYLEVGSFYVGLEGEKFVCNVYSNKRLSRSYDKSFSTPNIWKEKNCQQH